MEDNEVGMSNLTLEIVQDVSQDCKMTGDRAYGNDVEAQNNTIRDADFQESVPSTETSLKKEGINSNKCSSESKLCRGESWNPLEADFPANVKVESKRENIIKTGEVGKHQHILSIIDNGAANENYVTAQREENLTFSKNSGNDKVHEGQSNIVFENCLQRTKPENLSRVSQSTLFNVNSPDTSEENEKHLDGKHNAFEPKDPVHFSIYETKGFKTRESTKTKTPSTCANIKDNNLEDENSESKIWDPSCNFCIHEIEIKKTSHKKHPSNNITKENEKTITGMDLKRPASADSISDKSYTSTNISDEIEKKKKIKKEHSVELDPIVISRRQKQINYGKNTIGYQRYKEMVSKDRRKRLDPHTPPKREVYSRRGWDGLIKTWRRKLHKWDPSKREASDDDHSSLMSSSSILTLSDDSENLTDTITEPAAKKFIWADDVEIDGTSDEDPNTTNS